MSVRSKMTAIADVIRGKTGKSGTLTLDAMAEEINSLTTEDIIQHANIPDYVKAEALRVANRVESVREDGDIVFLAMSDSHYYGDQKDSDQYPDANGIQTDVGNLHAAQAAKILAYTLNIDFMAHLGDVTWGSSKTTSELLHSHVDAMSALLKEVHRDIPCFHAIGNHDTGIYYHQQMIEDGNTGKYTESDSYLYDNFTLLSASDDTVFSSSKSGGGYCYRDFADKKLRVFLLNTSENLALHQIDNGMNPVQERWFVNALLDLNSKSNAASWSFIVLSHYPADYGSAISLSRILKTYVNGESGMINYNPNDTYDFSNQNRAKMIAQFHGHTHNLLVSKLWFDNSTQYDAWRCCIPNAQYNRENYYNTVGNNTNISFKQDVTYPKTPNTAKDTSFVVNVIKPSKRLIHSFCYGAGPEEQIISYGTSSDSPATYTNVLDEVGYKADTYLSGGNEGVKTGSYTTGFIPAEIGDKLYCRNIGMQTGQDGHRLCFYDVNKNYLNLVKTTAAYNGFIYGSDGDIDTIVIGSSGDNGTTAYVRFCCSYIGTDSVVTVNEPIT